jgi:hypothetical protein
MAEELDLSGALENSSKAADKLYDSLQRTSTSVKNANKVFQESTIVLGRQAEAYTTIDVELIKGNDAKRTAVLLEKQEQSARKATLDLLRKDIEARHSLNIAELKAQQAKKTNFQVNKDLEAQRKKTLDALKAQIIARNKVNKGFFSLTTNGRLLSNTFATLRSKMLLVGFAASLIASTFGRLFKAAAEQELAQKKLSTALGRTSDALLNHASAMQANTRFGDENIIETQAQIAAFIKDEEQIKKLTEATLDLAAAKGMDLKTAGDLVAKSVGSSTNALSRYGIVVSGSAKSTERIESAVKNISILFGGQAKDQAQTMAGALDQMKNAGGDAAEALGDLLYPITIVVVKGLTVLFKVVEKTVDTLVSLASSVTDFLFSVQDERGIIKEASKNLELYNTIIGDMNYEQLKKELGDVTVEEKKHNDQIKINIEQAAIQDKLNFNNVQTLQQRKEVTIALKESELKLAEVQKEMLRREGLAIELMGQTNIGKRQELETQKEFIESNKELFKTVGEDGVESYEAYNKVLEITNSQLSDLEKAEVKLKLTKAKALSEGLGGFGDLLEAQGASAKSVARIRQVQALIDSYAAYNLALATYPPPFNIIAAGGALASGLAQVAKIESASKNIKKAAIGADFVTSGPQMMMVGENPGGRERVQVTPLSSPNIAGPEGGASIVVNVSGNLMSSEYVEGELADQIREAVRRGSDFGIS